MQRIPTLDGWRGVAILMVLVTHAADGFRWKHLDMGQHGVTIFFVLSGFLITSRLIERDKIDLKSFYLRRLFRIAPCSLVYIATIAALGKIVHHDLTHSLMSCLLFFRNYVPDTGANAMTGHFWSLSIEEQFYFVWPCLLLLAGRRKALLAATVAVLSISTYRVVRWQHYNNLAYRSHTEVRADALLAGCILALSIGTNANAREWLIRRSSILVLCASAVLVWDVLHFHLLVPLSETVAITILIGCTSLSPHTAFGRALEMKHLKFIGVISYSLYVWQQVFLTPHWGPLAPVMISCVPLVAVASYGLIEQPFIRLGRRIEERLELRAGLLPTQELPAEGGNLRIPLADAVQRKDGARNEVAAAGR